MYRVFKKALVIADDLTGANDTIAQFAKLALSSVTVAFPSRFSSNLLTKLITKYDVIAVNTDSRALDPNKAYEAVFKVSEEIKTVYNGITSLLIYKKMDSTLRGNITEEIKAVYDSMKPQLIVFAPAFPKQGRTTLKGVHLVNNIPVDQTQFGKDTRKPVKTAIISAYFESVFKKYKHVFLEELRSGKVLELVREYEVLSFDVENDIDLRSIVDSVLACDKSVVWVGSAGLAEYIAYSSIFGDISGKPVLFVVGTLNDVTRAQINELIKFLKSRLVLINLNSLIEDFEAESKRIISEVKKALEWSEDIIITTSYSLEQVEQGRNLAKKLSMTLTDLGLLISRKIGELVNLLISNFGSNKFSGLFLSGGDVALAVLNELNIDFVKVVGEIEPGLPLLKYDNTYLVTKAGGFGRKDTLIKVATRVKMFE